MSYELDGMSEDAVKLAESMKRIACAAVGLAWQERVGYHMASLLASHACCSVLVYMNIANTDMVKNMVFASVSLAMRQYYDKYLPREIPAFNPIFKFVRKEVPAP